VRELVRARFRFRRFFVSSPLVVARRFRSLARYVYTTLFIREFRPNARRDERARDLRGALMASMQGY